MNGLEASRPWATTSSFGFTAPARIFSNAVSVASASTIMIATSPVLGDPAGDGEVEDGVLELREGRERDPLALDEGARRTPAIGPENGTPESWLEALAALIARAS